MESESVKKQWNEAAEPWTDFVRKGKDFYREEMNNPALFGLLGNIKGKKILDLACGEGSNTRILARKGATVVGVDNWRRKKIWG
jgi:2-polyprenyl-3-methyl-5-hydroxy-6-metoxy-1,4-benzoquinol methylase